MISSGAAAGVISSGATWQALNAALRGQTRAEQVANPHPTPHPHPHPRWDCRAATALNFTVVTEKVSLGLGLGSVLE